MKPVAYCLNRDVRQLALLNSYADVMRRHRGRLSRATTLPLQMDLDEAYRRAWIEADVDPLEEALDVKIQAIERCIK